jgi:hypothetical protein
MSPILDTIFTWSMINTLVLIVLYWLYLLFLFCFDSFCFTVLFCFAFLSKMEHTYLTMHSKCNNLNKNAENEHELLGFVYHTNVCSSHQWSHSVICQFFIPIEATLRLLLFRSLLVSCLTQLSNIFQ